MSGHNRWSKIKRQKAAMGATKGKLYSKVIKEITVSARLGGGDPAGNARLRVALAGGREELRESCWRRSCNCWTVASSVATRASSARIYACASTGVRSQISCDNEDGVFIDLYDMRHPPALASMTGWNHVNGY